MVACLHNSRFGQQRALRRETDVANQRSRTTIRDTIKRPPYPVLGRSFPGWSLLGLFRSVVGLSNSDSFGIVFPPTLSVGEG